MKFNDSNLNEMKELLAYISKKKEDEHKIVSIFGITIGAIIILGVNIFINSLNDIPKIVNINNWFWKFVLIFALTYNFFGSIFFVLRFIFNGNDQELKRNSEKKDKNELDRESLFLAIPVNMFSTFLFVIINIVSCWYLFQIDVFLFILNVFIFLDVFVIMFSKRRIKVCIAVILYFVLSLIILVFIYNKFSINVLVNYYLFLKYAIVLALYIIGISYISVFWVKVATYKWLIDLEDRIYRDELTRENVICELENVFLKRVRFGFFNKERRMR